MAVLRSVLSFFYENGYVLELLLAFSLFGCYFRKRRFFALRYLASALSLLALSLLFNFFRADGSFWLSLTKYLSMIALGWGGVLFCTHAKIHASLICLVGAVATQHLYFRVVSFLLSLTPYPSEGLFRGIVTVVVFALVYAAVFLFFRKPIKGSSDEGNPQNFDFLPGLGIIFVAIVLNLYEETFDLLNVNRPLLTAFSAYGILCCLFTLGLQYSLYRNIRLEVENMVLERLVAMQKEEYERSKEYIDVINVKCHDMKRQISLLEGRLEPEALDEIKSAIKIYETLYNTGNEVLDIFLAERSLSFEKNKVQFNCIVDGACLDFLKPSEIYALFGNAFDNAIEALKKVPEEDRIFSLSVKRQLDMAVIHMENTCNEELIFQDGLPRTTKGDLENHGFGMRSIRMVAERRKGSMAVCIDRGIFNLNILLPLP